MINRDYWTTAAQTMPVLALAAIIEARAIVARWTPGEMRVYKSLLGLLWAIPLAVYAFAVPACFRALSDEKVWSGWPPLINGSISMSLSTLVVTPLVELLIRSNARLFTGMLYLLGSRSFPFQRRWASRRVTKMKRTIALREPELAEAEARIDLIEAEVRRSGYLTGEEDSAALVAINEARSEIGDYRSHNRNVLEQLDAIEKTIQQSKERSAVTIQELEAAIERGPYVDDTELDATFELINKRIRHAGASPEQGDNGSTPPSPPT